MSSERLIHLCDVSKSFSVFVKPQDRLKQTIFPRLMHLLKPWATHNIYKYYQEFRALNNISFDVNRGETIGIIGKNGSGKSTLLQIICGILQVDSGDVEVQGRVAALLELGAGFNPEFTGRENVYLNAAILGLTECEITERFDEIVVFSEIGEFIDRPVKTYSSGMFMRLAFSVATSVDPDIVVVDEALAVGDVAFSMKCIQRIDEMRERGVTILLVSHDVALVRSMCSRVLYLRDRECIFDGDAETGTELYLMDMRSEQAAVMGQKMSFQKSLDKGGMAFGTGVGRVRSVSLSCGDEVRNWFRYGERMSINVKAWFGEELCQPTLAIAIRDHKGVVIAGFDGRNIKGEGDDNEIHYQFSLDARMLPGIYNVAVRILDFPFGSSDVLIEKQLNAAMIEMIDDHMVDVGTCGLVGLNGVCEQII